MEEVKYTGCFGRNEVSFFVPPFNSVLISISDPDRPQAEVRENVWLDVLRLQFWDVERRLPLFLAGGRRGPIDHTTKIIPTDALWVEPATTEQIKQIYDFIKKHEDKNIFAHCEAGISRSSAVREFLRRRGWVYWDKNGLRDAHPNTHILSQLERKEAYPDAENEDS